jgi:hypothetical protein
MRLTARNNPKLYEINTLVWLSELSRTHGKPIRLGNVPEEQWDRLQRLGFDHVWLMGIWKRSAAGLKLFKENPAWPLLRAGLDRALPGWTDDDLAGSPYSIAFYSPEPSIGTWADIDSVREMLHKRNMTLVLDFVPNHTAPDHPWLQEHPEFYIRGTETEFNEHPGSFTAIRTGERTLYVARGRDPYFAPWPDTLQLNYFDPELQSALIGELKNIAGHCDGVRCDMAMLVLNDIFDKTWGWTRDQGPTERPEFWELARRALPGFLLIAEAYWDMEWRLQQLGFDFTYDKRLCDRLCSSSARDVNLHLAADLLFQRKLVRFIENHDEPRSAGVFGREHLRAAAVITSTSPGMKFFQHGQLEGRKIQTPLLLTRVMEERPDADLKAFYGKLLSIIRSEVFRKGEWRLLEARSAGDDGFSNLVAYRWKLKDDLKLIVVNLGTGWSQGRIPLDRELTGNGDHLLNDELNDVQYVRSGSELVDPGLHVVLDGHHSHVFDVRQMSRRLIGTATPHRLAPAGDGP